jgi:hypothetical protein
MKNGVSVLTRATRRNVPEDTKNYLFTETPGHGWWRRPPDMVIN